MLSQNEVKELLSTSLADLGLSEQEIGLYAVSLSLGPSSIATLSEIIGVSRPNMYKLIASLETHGLARFSNRKKYAKTFMVESPNVIADLLHAKELEMERQHKLITQSLPDLLGLYRQGDLPTSLKVFEGIEACRNAFLKIFEETKEKIYYFGSVEDLFDLVADPEKSWMKVRLAKKIPIDVLVLPSEDAQDLKRTDELQLRETRFLQNSLPFSSSFYIYGKKVILWQPKAPMAILIEDENISGMMMSMFQMLWNMANTQDVKN